MNSRSVHNIYPEFSDQVVERWQKATIHAVAGTRLDPYQTGKRITFLMMSRDENFSVETRVLAFDYDSDVIELYSEREKKLFASLNRDAIQRGLLKPYAGEAPDVDTTNALSDEELADILAIATAKELHARLQTLTAMPPLRRLLDGLTDNHKQWFARAIEKRIQEIEEV